MTTQINSKMSSKSLAIMQNIDTKSIEKQDDRTVIRDVVIIQSGYDKTRDFFTKSFIESIVEQGNSQEQGVKARFGHPQLCKTTLGSALGRFKNFRITQDDDRHKAIADLHLLKLSKETNVEGRDISLHDYVVGLAKEDSAMFGNSIVYSFKQKEREESDELPDDYDREHVQTLESLIASDIVDSPAATTHLYKDTDDLGVMLSNFMSELDDEQEEQLINTLENRPQIVTHFLTRYKQFKKSKKEDMSILKAVKSIFNIEENDDKKKDFEMTTGDGAIVTVVTDEDRTTPQVGDAVQNEDGSAIEDGDHVMSDGSTISTQDGEITSITPAEDEASSDDAEESEELKSLKSYFDTQFKELKDSITSERDARETKEKETDETIKLIARNMKSEIDIDKAEKASKEDDDSKEDRLVAKKENK